MKRTETLLAGTAALVAAIGFGGAAWAATTVQIGGSGKTFASSLVQCAGVGAPMVEAGLFNPKRSTSAIVSLNGTPIKQVTADDPVANVPLTIGNHTVVVAISRKTADSYLFAVGSGTCSGPDTSGNTFNADHTLEYAASGKSYATVTPGCAMSPKTGQPQPYVNLFDNGGFLLNVSVNGVPLTQLSALKPHTPVFLSAGQNVISAANGSLSTDHYVRDGGDGRCVLTQ